VSQRQQQGAQTKSIGNYILGRTIGEGTFGKVKLGRHILSGANVAVKVLQKDRIVEVADVERVAREVHILKLIRHPHIVQLFEIIETRGQLYLIMEYASGGELFDYIVSKGRVPEQEACRFFHQIIAGVEKIHESHVVHRDLKPENLLLDEHKGIKIVDFGLSNLFRDGQRLSTACGSPCYAPPEMVAGQQYVPQMCDLWSCGVILFALVCGYLPFEDQNTAALYKKILAADYQVPTFISDAVKDLIGGLLTADPARRFTIANVRAHPWYRQCPESSLQPAGDGGSVSLDEDVLHELEAYGFPRDYALRCLELNKHNHITTTYYLLLERKRKVLEQLDVDGSLGASRKTAAGEQPSQQKQQVTSGRYSSQGQHSQQPQQPYIRDDGTQTPVPPGSGNDFASSGGRTPHRPGQPRDSSQTPRCETGRTSAQGRRVSAGTAGFPRPNTSPNRRGESSARGAKPGISGPEGVSITGATIAAPRTQSPWRSQTPNGVGPQAYSARGRTPTGNGGGVPEGLGSAGGGVPGAPAAGPAGHWRAGDRAAPHVGFGPHSARGPCSPQPGAGPAGHWRAGDRAAPHVGFGPHSARGKSPVGGGADAGGYLAGKSVHGASGNSVGDNTNGASAGTSAGGGVSWRTTPGAQSTTPQVTPRVGTPRTAFTPRGPGGPAGTTPRAATPQGTAVYRHASGVAPGQASTLPAGVTPRGTVTSSRRRPPTSQGANGISQAGAVTPVRPSGPPSSRMIWR